MLPTYLRVVDRGCRVPSYEQQQGRLYTSETYPAPSPGAWLALIHHEILLFTKHKIRNDGLSNGHSLEYILSRSERRYITLQASLWNDLGKW